MAWRGLARFLVAKKLRYNFHLRTIEALENARPRRGFTIAANDELRSVRGVEEFTSVEGGARISSLPLQSIPDLALRHAASVELSELQQLSVLPGFGPDAEFGALGLGTLPLVRSLEPLTSIERLDQLALNGVGVPHLQELRGWAPGLRRLSLIELETQTLQGLEELVALDELILARLPKLQSLSALENLREIRGDLMINRLDALEALDFPALERVDGNVEITENPRLSKAAIEDFLARVEITGEVRDCLNATQKPCF